MLSVFFSALFFHKGLLPDSNFADWSLDMLSEIAGDQVIEVEHRDGEGARFGQGWLRKMEFKAFVRAVSEGDVSLYLTTQSLKTAPGSKPPLMAPPVTQLAQQEAFPLRPLLLGSLIPAVVRLYTFAMQGLFECAAKWRNPFLSPLSLSVCCCFSISPCLATFFRSTTCG